MVCPQCHEPDLLWTILHDVAGNLDEVLCRVCGWEGSSYDCDDPEWDDDEYEDPILDC